MNPLLYWVGGPIALYLVIGMVLVGMAQIWVHLPFLKFIQAVFSWPRFLMPRSKEESDASDETTDTDGQNQ